MQYTIRSKTEMAQAALTKRLGKDFAGYAADLEGGGLWVMPKHPRARTGGSAAESPLPRPGQPS